MYIYTYYVRTYVISVCKYKYSYSVPICIIETDSEHLHMITSELTISRPVKLHITIYQLKIQPAECLSLILINIIYMYACMHVRTAI